MDLKSGMPPKASVKSLKGILYCIQRLFHWVPFGRFGSNAFFNVSNIWIIDRGIGSDWYAVLIIAIDRIHGEISVHIFHIRQGGRAPVRIGHRYRRITFNVY